MKKTVERALAALLCAVVLAGVLAGCSSAAPGSPSAREQANSPHVTMGESDLAAADAAMAASPEENGMAQGGSGAKAAASLSGQKIIERLSYRLETLNFVEATERIQQRCAELGGYIQESSIDGKTGRGLRYAHFTLRIPQENLTKWKESMPELATVLNSSSTSENITEQYFDTESRLKSLRLQQERLLDLLKKAAALPDIIELENALANCTAEIESLTGNLRGFDSLISFATVTIELSEVVVPSEAVVLPVTLWEKITAQLGSTMNGLKAFGEGLLVFLIGCAPVLILLALIALAVVLIMRRYRKRHPRTVFPAPTAIVMPTVTQAAPPIPATPTADAQEQKKP